MTGKVSRFTMESRERTFLMVLFIMYLIKCDL